MKKLINFYEVFEYTYESREERDKHVAERVEKGFIDSGKLRRLKPEVSIYDATENDYEWYSQLTRYMPLK